MDTTTEKPSKPVTKKSESYFRLRGRVSTEPEMIVGEYPARNGSKPTPTWQYNFDVSAGPRTIGVAQTVTTGPQDLVQPEFGEWIMVDIISSRTVGEKGVYKTEVKGNIFRD